jgi:hypothetical protein
MLSEHDVEKWDPQKYLPNKLEKVVARRLEN